MSGTVNVYEWNAYDQQWNSKGDPLKDFFGTRDTISFSKNGSILAYGNVSAQTMCILILIIYKNSITMFEFSMNLEQSLFTSLPIILGTLEVT